MISFILIADGGSHVEDCGGNSLYQFTVPIHCTEEDRRELERLSKGRTDEARKVERARLVLRCLAGKHNDEVATEFGVQAVTVGTWRRRFASEGLAD